MHKEIILFPAGGNAREALVQIQSLNQTHYHWKILGFVDDDPSQWGQEILGFKVLGGRAIFNEFPNAQVLAVPGNVNTYRERSKCILGLNFDVSKFAQIGAVSSNISSDAKIGYNTLIMPNVFISCGVAIGNHCIILPNSVIHHDSIIEDYCCIGSNVTVCGGVKIKSNSYIGSGSSIRENIVIGEKSLVGLGTNVISNVIEEVTVVGNPARVLST